MNDELRKAAEAVLAAAATYDRMGEICSFEGAPMIYGNTLEELADIARDALAAPSACSEPPVAYAARTRFGAVPVLSWEPLDQDGKLHTLNFGVVEVVDLTPLFASPTACSEPVPEGCTPTDARILREANHAFVADNERLRTALRFYANGDHFHTDPGEEFDTVSGEPTNWLFSGLDDSQTMIEDGEVACQALRNEATNWIDGGDDEAPKEIEGEKWAARAPAVLPPVSQAEPLTDEQIVEQCMAAGIKWIAPDDDPDGYPGGFDMCSLADVRKLLEGATPSPEVKASATPGEGA